MRDRYWREIRSLCAAHELIRINKNRAPRLAE